MAKLTNQEVLDEVVSLYQTKQDLATLDDTLNTQAAVIMDKARADVAALKEGQAAARGVLQGAIAVAEARLNKGK